MPLDLKLAAFRLLMEAPVPALRTRARRGYYGRRRRYARPNLERVLARLPGNPVVLDLGAHRGWFLQNVLDRAGEIHAVEPDPVAFAALEEAFGSDPRARLINPAVGDSSGETAFFRPAGSEGKPDAASVSASVFGSHLGVAGGSRITVPQIDICELLERVGRPVDLVKMDIEGAAVPVLERLFATGMISRIGTLLVETHEHCLPELTDRTHALRLRARRLERPLVDFDWV